LESSPNLPAGAWTAINGPYYLAGPYFEYWEARANLQTTKFFRLHYTGAIVLSGPPPLAIQSSNSGVTLAWPAALAGFILETTTNLVPPVTWVPLPGSALTVTNGQIEYRQNLRGQSPLRFYRLRSP
jgi:hypothetical protein